MSAVREWLLRQTARDRKVLALGALVIALALGWAFLWQPLVQGRKSLAQQVVKAEGDVALMRSIASDVKQRRASGLATGLDRAGQSLLALADSSAREAGLGDALARVEPVNEGRVNVWFEDAGFDVLVTWLESLSQRFGIGIEELAIDRSNAVGVVNARITLTDPATH